MRGWLRRSWPALVLVLLALALRCYGLGAPLLDYHAWRQADTAAIARNYTTNGYRLLYPQVDWGGLTPGYVESEFPLYTYALALLYGIFGVREWLGRLLSALAAAAAVVALYALVRGYNDGIGHREASHRQRLAIYAGLALALMPFPIYFGRTVMPDTWMLLAAIVAIWTFQRWLECPSVGRYATALLCGALAPLAKMPNLPIVAMPLAYMVFTTTGRVSESRASTKDERRKTKDRAFTLRPSSFVAVELLVYGACFALPSLIWLLHARALPLDPHLSFGIGEKLFDTRLLLDPQFYLLLARWSVQNILTLAGLPFFILGLIPSTKNQEPRTENHTAKNKEQRTKNSTSDGGRRIDHATHDTLLPHFWLLGVLLFFFAGAAGVVGQDYYILPLAGPAAWFVGIGIARAQRFLEATTARRLPPEIASGHSQQAARGTRHSRWFSILIPAIALTALVALSFYRVMPLYRTTEFYRTLGRRVDLALPVGERVGVIAPAVSEILYYGGRTGWRLDPGVLVPGGLASLPPDLGVRYVLVADPALTERRDVLTAALREYRRIPVGPYALLLDLSAPGSQRPAEMAWETGHLVEEPFLSYWRAAGGVARLGHPLSDALDGPEGREQYFERAVLLENDNKVERLPVGRLLLDAQGRALHTAEIAAPFRAAWEAAGGEQGLGRPLSSLLDEAGAQLQFFEFGLLESRPGSAPAVGAAGRRLLEARGLTEERQIELAARSAP